MFRLIYTKESKKEDSSVLITKDERASVVRDYNYSEVSEIEYSNCDVPVMALLEYDDFGNLIYEDYSNLDVYLEEEFIPKNIIYRKKYNFEIEDYEYISVIKLYSIVKLKCSQKEVEYIMNYLCERGITVGGESSTLDGEFENYKYYNNYKNLEDYCTTIDTKEMLNKFRDYNSTKCSKLREELIIANFRLVEFVAYPFSIRGGWDINDLISYGSEGLIKAVDKFDTSLGNKFSTFAVPCIKGYIMNGIFAMRGYTHFALGKNIFSAQSIVERNYCEKLENNLEMIDDIFDLLVSTGKMSEESAKEYKVKEQIKNACSLEDVIDDENLVDNNTLYYEVFRNITKDYIKNSIINNLPDREKTIIEDYYGFIDDVNSSYKAIAKKFGVTGSAIHQKKNTILKKIRTLYDMEELHSMLELYDEYNYEPIKGKIKAIK